MKTYIHIFCRMIALSFSPCDITYPWMLRDMLKNDLLFSSYTGIIQIIHNAYSICIFHSGENVHTLLKPLKQKLTLLEQRERELVVKPRQ